MKSTVLFAVGIVLVLTAPACSAGGKPTKQEVFVGFVASLGGTGKPGGPTLNQVKNFQCEKAVGEPGYNCTFDIPVPGHEITHFQVRAIQGDGGVWTVRMTGAS